MKYTEQNQDDKRSLFIDSDTFKKLSEQEQNKILESESKFLEHNPDYSYSKPSTDDKESQLG